MKLVDLRNDNNNGLSNVSKKTRKRRPVEKVTIVAYVNEGSKQAAVTYTSRADYIEGIREIVSSQMSQFTECEKNGTQPSPYTTFMATMPLKVRILKLNVPSGDAKLMVDKCRARLEEMGYHVIRRLTFRASGHVEDVEYWDLFE